MRHLSWVIGVGLVLASSPSADARPYASTKRRASRRHPVVILAPRPAAAIATLRIQFRAGGVDDGTHPGLTRLTQQAMLSSNAAGSHSKFLKAMFESGATLGLETGTRTSAITLTAPKKAFAELAPRLIKMVLSPRFTLRGFEDTKSRALHSRSNMESGTIASLFARVVFSEDGYANDPQGDKDSVRSLSIGAVSKHARGPLAPANATVVVAGAFSARKIKAALARSTGGKRRRPERPQGAAPGRYDRRSPIEMHLTAIQVEPNGAAAIAAIHLASTIIQERVQNTFRRKGIAYSTSAAPMHREWLDFIMVLVPIRGGVPATVTEALNAQIMSIGRGNFLEGEFDRNKKFLLANLAAVDRDPRALSALLAMGDGDQTWLSPKVVAEVEKLDEKAFVERAGPWLNEAKFFEVLFAKSSGRRSARRNR